MDNVIISVRHKTRGLINWMNIEKLNILWEEHRKFRRDETFNEIYAELEPQRSQNRRLVERSGYGDESDALTVFDEVLMRLIRSDNVKDFAKSLTTSLKNARTDFYRKETRRLAHVHNDINSASDDTDETPTSLELYAKTDDDIVEQAVFDHMHKKKEADKRQLIDFLLCPARTVDTVTTLIVTRYNNASPKESDNAIAKSLGLHHETVKRKLHALSRRYDANRFGDISDYLAV